MGIRDILVFLDPTTASDVRLHLAIDLARKHDAKVLGVDASTEAAFAGEWHDRAVELQDRFEAALEKFGVTGVFAGLGPPEPRGVFATHFTDLIVAPPPEFEGRALVSARVPEGVLEESGVPMIVVPTFWTHGPVGESAVIAWNASREATRAVRDALPVLRKARKVTIFTTSSDTDRSGSDRLAEHLARHGVTAQTTHWTNNTGLTVVEALLACISDEDADLIVAGAFGRARWFENLFGGVSRELIRLPGLPVLMSH